MSRSRRLFKLIEPTLPGVVLCKDMLVVTPTRHIVRGFLLETTTEKGRVYLWCVITPLHRPISSVILNYSDRIPETGEIYIKPDALQESADHIRAIIEQHVAYLRTIETPADFLRHASWIVDGSPILSRIDRALALYLAGDTSRSTESLRALKAEADRLDARRREYIGPVLEQIVHAFDTDPRSVAPLLEKWESQNVERLGLQASRKLPAIASPAIS
jgi:hypothetical protein